MIAPATHIIYLAGPCTGMPDHNYPAFDAAAERLRAQGYVVINPADVAVTAGAAWVWFMRRALVNLADADALAVLPGWELSRGARLEVLIARELGMPVVHAADLTPVNPPTRLAAEGI